MDGCLEEWLLNGWMLGGMAVKWMDAWMDGWMDGWMMAAKTDRLKHGCMIHNAWRMEDGWMVDAWIEARMFIWQIGALKLKINLRQFSSSVPSLQSASPSQYQCSAMQLPSEQRNSLSEHFLLSGHTYKHNKALRFWQWEKTIDSFYLLGSEWRVFGRNQSQFHPIWKNTNKCQVQTLKNRLDNLVL